MAIIHCNYSSPTLGHPVDLQVLLPEPTPGVPAPARHPTLWLLHGMFGCYSDWCRYSLIERYAAQYRLAVVMASAENSYYADMVHGDRYFTFFTEELPQVCRDFFPLSDRPEDNCIAGLSMGGYGAMKIGLTYPERFRAVCSFSGTLDIASLCSQQVVVQADLISQIFGERGPVGAGADLFQLLRGHAAAGRRLPELYAWCGADDILLEDNNRFAALCRDLSIPLTYQVQPGAHEWDFWNDTLRQFLAAVYGISRSAERDQQALPAV